MSMFKGSDRGDFDLRGLVQYVELIGVVKIKIRGGGWVGLHGCYESI